MERIKIQLPKQFSFSTTIPIRITDLNYGNHVGNDTFLSLIHEARLQYLESFGFTELSFAGVGLIMADVAIEFKQELSYGDKVTIQVIANGFDKLGFDIFYKLSVTQNEKEVLVGKAKTGMVCFDYTAKKTVAVPPAAIDKINALLIAS